jgi:hypothetical protein
MVAGQSAHKAVLNHPAGAIGTLEPVSAGSAQSQRRISPPVQEQQALFAALDPFFQGL